MKPLSSYYKIKLNQFQIPCLLTSISNNIYLGELQIGLNVAQTDGFVKNNNTCKIKSYNTFKDRKESL